jgi:hypothetical protein
MKDDNKSTSTTVTDLSEIGRILGDSLEKRGLDMVYFILLLIV